MRDLLSMLPDGASDHPDYCGFFYRTWEREVAEPALQAQGYTVLSWGTGERDSFGPLTRFVRLKKNGERIDAIYG